MVGAVFSIYIINHFSPALIAEINVDIRHRHPLRVEKALEIEGILDGVQIGDAQAVGDHRTRRRTPARSHRYILALGVADKIRHNEKIVHKTHADNHIQLHPQPVLIVLASVGIAPGKPLLTQLFQIAPAVPLPVRRQLEFRQVIRPELEIKLT